MTKVNQVVFVIDDDPSMRGAMKRLLEAVGYRVETYGAGQDFLKSELPDAPACVVLDVRLPGSSGLELQREMASKGINIPVIFVTGHGDIPMSVQAMKAGAVEFLTKPFRDQDLLDAISQAVKRDRAARRQRDNLAEMRKNLDSLTPRELEVMTMVVAGMLNKQIASDLGISEKTIKVHRANVMHKMQAGSLAELVRMADKMGINHTRS